MTKNTGAGGKHVFGGGTSAAKAAAGGWSVGQAANNIKQAAAVTGENAGYSQNWGYGGGSGWTSGGGSEMSYSATSAAEQRAYNSAEAALARQWSADEAKKNRDWQEQMSNTAWQRAVKDMKAAGINPMLSYMLGGATTPSGSMGQSFAATSAADAMGYSYGSNSSSGENGSWNQNGGFSANSGKQYDNFWNGLLTVGEEVIKGLKPKVSAYTAKKQAQSTTLQDIAKKGIWGAFAKQAASDTSTKWNR